MTLLMLLLARAYAPLGARGALVDGMRRRESIAFADRRARSIRSTNKPFHAHRRHAGAAHAQDDGESLAA